MIAKVLALNIPVAICNIYYPNFSERLIQFFASIGLRFVNGIIYSVAQKHNLPYLDLAYIFNDSKDYANPIEPVTSNFIFNLFLTLKNKIKQGIYGGDKLTNNIVKILKNYDFKKMKFEVFKDRIYSDDVEDQNQKVSKATNTRESANPISNNPINQHYREEK